MLQGAERKPRRAVDDGDLQKRQDLPEEELQVGAHSFRNPCTPENLLHGNCV